MRWLPGIIFLMLIATGTNAQTAKDPFVGGIEISIGYGNIIDFNLDNNNLYREYLLERLIWLPFQVGIVADKYLSPNNFIEFGMMFARHSSSYVYRHNYNIDGSYGTGLPVLELFSMDIPLKYYAYVGKVWKQHMYAYGGIIPSWLLTSDTGSDYNEIPEDCFRRFCISVCGGLCCDVRKSRVKLHAGLAVTSVVNANYREIPQEERGYGGRIFPFELLFCYARMFR